MMHLYPGILRRMTLLCHHVLILVVMDDALVLEGVEFDRNGETS